MGKWGVHRGFWSSLACLITRKTESMTQETIRWPSDDKEIIFRCESVKVYRKCIKNVSKIIQMYRVFVWTCNMEVKAKAVKSWVLNTKICVSIIFGHTVSGSRQNSWPDKIKAQYAAPNMNQIHQDVLRGKTKRIVVEKWFLSLEPKQR